MNTEIQNKVVWHSGDVVLLNGETETAYGADWWLGVWVTGHRTGQDAVVRAGSHTETYEYAMKCFNDLHN